jgi:chaperonin cofactor prefoldin
MAKKNTAPKEEHPTFLEGILPEGISQQLGGWLQPPGKPQRWRSESIDDAMYIGMIGSLYYFQWKAQKVLQDEWVKEYGDVDPAIAQLRALIEQVLADINSCKDKINEIDAHLKKIQEDLQYWLRERDIWPQEGQTDQKTWYAYCTTVINGLMETQKAENAAKQEWNDKIKVLQGQWYEYNSKISKLQAELKKGGKCPQIDYITPLFVSMALAYLLKHSEGAGSVLVVSAALAIIALPAVIDPAQEIVDDINENPWLPAFGLAGIGLKYVYDEYKEAKGE